MADSANLSIPFLEASQRSEHITVNEALQILDAAVHLSVIDRDLTSPPASPNEGDRYLVATGATGAWAGWDDSISYYAATAWHRLEPKDGWRCWVQDESLPLIYDGAWRDYLQNLPSVGVNATADTTNRLSVASSAVLFNNVGSDHQFKINKAAAGDTASLLFQTGFSGRAEMGTAGNDDWSIKVSPDGSTFFDAIVVDKDTGNVGVQTSSPAATLDVGGPVRVGSYTVSSVPSASGLTGSLIYVSDETGGAVIAFSDGTDWRRMTDLAVIS